MRPSKIILAALPAALLLAAPALSAPINLVTNGSFEITSIATGGKDYFQGKVTGWSGGANLTFLDSPGTADDGSYLSVYKGFPNVSPDGGRFVEADGDPSYRNAITQQINGLVAGVSYTLTFYQGAGQQVNFKGATTERWQVSLGKDTQFSTRYNLPEGGTGPWQQQVMTFVASASSELLSFLADGTPNGAPPISFLDGVSLVQNVPEPVTLSLLGTGLLGTLAFRRRSKPAA